MSAAMKFFYVATLLLCGMFVLLAGIAPRMLS